MFTIYNIKKEKSLLFVYKKGKYFLILTFMVCALFIGCEDDNNNGDPSAELVFDSLVAEKDTMKVGETITITANATGYNLSYYWSASLGDLLGSGSQIIYAATKCHIGSNEVTCEVKDGNNVSQSKIITIVVE